MPTTTCGPNLRTSVHCARPCSETRSNQTHESSIDADARLARKGDGKESRLSYCGNLLVENRNGLIADAELLEATGTARRQPRTISAKNTIGR